MTVPPYESKGSGTPTIGITPITIDVFKKTYKNKLIPTPIATILPKIEND